MKPALGTLVYLAALAASIVIRSPHDRRSQKTQVSEDRRGALEVALLVLMGVAVLGLPLVHAASGWLAFADHAQPAWAFVLGLGLCALWLWLFWRTHADLGANWSVSLQLRTEHRLVTTGVYARVRHPMYSALFVQAGAQACLLANWVAGPAMLAAFALMFALRLGPEERMLAERFGAEYELYARRTKRLVPWVW
jgi:protein-S-isoprenylcysteine O-methyltransferase Ste14